ncbi:hypothetical protein MC7420_3111 [Coleofasciculus chthonoplastes PCC 7420]|uniref:eCIS core domain-containing protein n=1 Tax=Coleofasciculus chthonoplastes PCC 7420 TaxID=118168 RepID=B4VKD2_9CYAN|nr:DUF4157 domain-containing protein [Coleofasciculus chthonoplastes]EDX77787.1 hypothetical protein MC7420_3111 [Coleofasciculus chthonoplastes PCC 7420]
MYKPLQKKNSSWTPTTAQKKSKSPSKLGHFSIQPKPNKKSSQPQEIGEYSRDSADRLAANVMRSLEAKDSQETETPTVQPQSESRISVADVVGQRMPTVMARPLTPQVRMASEVSPENPIQRQCADCASPQQEQSTAAGKDIEQISSEAGAIQTKLTVGTPGDPYEQEADRVAAQVVSMSSPSDNSAPVQRLAQENNPIQRESLAQSITPVVQRRLSEQVQTQGLVQRAFQAGGTEASEDLESRLNASKGGGSPLSEDVRGFMEPRFGSDFSGVRVHTGGEAVQMNQELGAQAFTHGQDIFFNQGKYNPGSTDGKLLLAHEMTHVVQQTGAVSPKQEQQSIQSESSAHKVPGYLQSIFSSQQGNTALYRKELQDFQQVNSNKTLDQYQSQLQEPNQRVEITQTAPLQQARLMMRGNSAPGKPGKQVSSKAMSRLDKAKEAIKHTKSVFLYGAGNQTEALKATNFNSQFRLLVMRDDPQVLEAVGATSFWQLTDSVKPIAAANPEALTAAKADLAHGGNCGEHAEVAFDYLRVQAVGETLHWSSKQGLDHDFVLMGVPEDTDADIVVADPWPTRATATTWEDHFAYTSDREKIQRKHSMVADGQNVKAVIAAGLTLTDKGKQVAALKRSNKQTKELLKRSKELHFWTHSDAAAKGHDYDYHT